jgi:hypothetical protein
MRIVGSLLGVVAWCVVASGPTFAGPAPGATAAASTYRCPMHCEGDKTYDAAKPCPVCGMALGLVHGGRYRVTVAAKGGTVAPGVATDLTIAIADPHGTRVRDLDVVHEKLLHLLVTSEDLAWFAHEHPERRPDGTFALRMTFPAPGRYTLFHDFTPPRVGMQVVPVELTVAGTAPPRAALVPDAATAKTVDGVTARLAPSGPLVAGKTLTLVVSLAENGEPVDDLEPFLGAMGHLIVVSADRERFVHSHPVEPRGSAPARGPDLRFQCQFPAGGIYKAWAQFQRAGRVLTVPFTFAVGAG